MWSQIGPIFDGRLGGAFKFRQASNQLREQLRWPAMPDGLIHHAGRHGRMHKRFRAPDS